MPVNEWSAIIKKSMAYDLFLLLDDQPEKTYTAEEVKKIIKAYIAANTQM